MSTHFQPELEALRQQVLRQYQILDTEPEKNFDELTRLAAQICGTSMAIVGFLDGNRVWLKARVGCNWTEIGRADSLCQFVENAPGLFKVNDALAQEEFARLPWVRGTPGIRAFAGAPLRGRLGSTMDGTGIEHVVGMLCVFDSEPREWREQDLHAITALAEQVRTHLKLRKSTAELRRKNAELQIALEHSESFYHSLVETIPQNIFRKDLKGRFTFANTRFCEAVGRNPDEVMGRTDFDLFPAELAAKYQQDDRRVLEVGQPLKAIEQHRDKQGNTLYVQVIKSPLRDRNGQICGVQGIFWDETERFKAEEALAYERDLLRAMLDNIPDSIYFKDRQSRFLAISRSLAGRLGLKSPAEAIGRTDRDFFHLVHAEAALLDEQTILRSGQAMVGKMEKEVWRDGTERWILTTKVPLHNAQKEIIGTFGVSKDITQLKDTEAELAMARDAALESARMKSEFLANMSHEIRTPLNAVIGMSGLLMETPLNEEQRDFANTIRSSADGLLNIINDILDFSKIEAGKMAIENIEFDLNEVVEGTTELVAESAQIKNLELAAWIHEDVPRLLRGDPGRIRQILTNLLGNGVKFTQEGEVVLQVHLLRQSENHALLKFVVRDTGVGIPPGAQTRLFQAFYQADGSTTRKYGGTGLGLAICRQLVELMHGEIGCESVPGKGSEFWFTIPLEKQADQQRTMEMASTLEGYRVLVVDDNDTNREIVHRQIVAWKMRNGSVSNGAEAIAALEKAVEEKDPFQVAILDMQMPEMDGITLAARIKANPALAATQMIMLTSLGNLPEERQWREAGIAAYLVKPVKESRLYDTLITVLRGKGGIARSDAAGMISSRSRQPLRLLVAEDNIVNQKVALRQLQKLGYSADAVANGLEVLHAIRQIPYDMILMDCQMPELDGYEATRLIRSEESKSERNDRRFYIIAMTANAMAGDREECLTSGMDDYISKPVRIEELEAAIDRGAAALKDAAAKDAELLDEEVLQSVRDLRSPGESDPLAELIDLFLQDTPVRIGKILDSFKAGDVEGLERAAHSLKGSASNLGAKHLASACFGVMAAGRSGKLPDAAMVAKVLSEFERLKPALERAKSS